MKYLFLLATLTALVAPMWGCCCASGGTSCFKGDGVADDCAARKNRYKQIIDNDCKQMTDDWDYFWLMDDKSHLSQWQVQ